MYQPDTGNYRTNESLGKAFMHSCLGKLVILGAFILVVFLIALMTKPTDQEMLDETYDNIMECIHENDSIKGDDIDDYIFNIGFTFSEIDSTLISEDVKVAFNKLNRIEAYRHTFFSTTYLFNNIHPAGVRVGVGVFGLVIPTIKYSDILLDAGPVHKGYDQRLAPQTIIKDTDLGTNPNIQEYHYQRNPDN